MNLFQQFERMANTRPNKPAFIFREGRDWNTLTYKQLLDQTNRFFSGLLAGPLTPGMTAAVMTPPSAEFFPFALALLKFGIIPIILDPAIGLKKVGEILRESQPDIFIGNTLTHTLRRIFNWGKDSIKHNLSIKQVASYRLQVTNPNSNPRSPITNHQSPMTNTAAIIYTSGSTGLPKGAV